MEQTDTEEIDLNNRYGIVCDDLNSVKAITEFKTKLEAAMNEEAQKDMDIKKADELMKKSNPTLKDIMSDITEFELEMQREVKRLNVDLNEINERLTLQDKLRVYNASVFENRILTIEGKEIKPVHFVYEPSSFLSTARLKTIWDISSLTNDEIDRYIKCYLHDGFIYCTRNDKIDLLACLVGLK